MLVLLVRADQHFGTAGDCGLQHLSDSAGAYPQNAGGYGAHLRSRLSQSRSGHSQWQAAFCPTGHQWQLASLSLSLMSRPGLDGPLCRIRETCPINFHLLERHAVSKCDHQCVPGDRAGRSCGHGSASMASTQGPVKRCPRRRLANAGHSRSMRTGGFVRRIWLLL